MIISQIISYKQSVNRFLHDPTIWANVTDTES